MEALLALVVGVLFAAGVYLLMDGNLVRAVFGLILMSNAANLLFFTAGRVMRGVPPLVPEGMAAPAGVVANPLAQALVLTAIVIGFGLVSFALVLVYRYQRTFGTVEVGGADETVDTEEAVGTAEPVTEAEREEAAARGRAGGGPSWLRRRPRVVPGAPVAALSQVDPEPQGVR
jgi:multicomponent Na+:H+ antiporter subunit C